MSLVGALVAACAVKATGAPLLPLAVPSRDPAEAEAEAEGQLPDVPERRGTGGGPARDAPHPLLAVLRRRRPFPQQQPRASAARSSSPSRSTAGRGPSPRSVLSSGDADDAALRPSVVETRELDALRTLALGPANVAAADLGASAAAALSVLDGSGFDLAWLRRPEAHAALLRPPRQGDDGDSAWVTLEGVAQGCRRRVNSPRSVLACLRLGVDPMALLPQPSDTSSVATATTASFVSGASAGDSEVLRQRATALRAALDERRRVCAALPRLEALSYLQLRAALAATGGGGGSVTLSGASDTDSMQRTRTDAVGKSSESGAPAAGGIEGDEEAENELQSKLQRERAAVRRVAAREVALSRRGVERFEAEQARAVAATAVHIEAQQRRREAAAHEARLAAMEQCQRDARRDAALVAAAADTTERAAVREARADAAEAAAADARASRLALRRERNASRLAKQQAARERLASTLRAALDERQAAYTARQEQSDAFADAQAASLREASRVKYEAAEAQRRRHDAAAKAAAAAAAARAAEAAQRDARLDERCRALAQEKATGAAVRRLVEWRRELERDDRAEELADAEAATIHDATLRRTARAETFVGARLRYTQRRDARRATAVDAALAKRDELQRHDRAAAFQRLLLVSDIAGRVERGERAAGWRAVRGERIAEERRAMQQDRTSTVLAAHNAMAQRERASYLRVFNEQHPSDAVALRSANQAAVERLPGRARRCLGDGGNASVSAVALLQDSISGQSMPSPLRGDSQPLRPSGSKSLLR